MTLADLMNGLETNREFVIDTLRPEAVNISKYILDPNDKKEVEKRTLQIIRRELNPKERVWEETSEHIRRTYGGPIDHVYVQSFKKDIDGAHVLFEHLAADLWRITKRVEGDVEGEDRRLPALTQVLVDAYEADEKVFEFYELDGCEWPENLGGGEVLRNVYGTNGITIHDPRTITAFKELQKYFNNPAMLLDYYYPEGHNLNDDWEGPIKSEYLRKTLFNQACGQNLLKNADKIFSSISGRKAVYLFKFEFEVLGVRFFITRDGTDRWLIRTDTELCAVDCDLRLAEEAFYKMFPPSDVWPRSYTYCQAPCDLGDPL